MDPQPLSTTWKDLVLALVRSDEVRCRAPEDGIALSCATPAEGGDPGNAGTGPTTSRGPGKCDDPRN